MFFQEILAVLADYFIYIFLMLILAFRTYKAIHVHHSKTSINKLQFWVYTITLLIGSLLLAINRGLYVFQAIATGMFVVMVILEAKDLGKIEVKVESAPTIPKSENTSSGRKKKNNRQEKKSIHPALKRARMDFFLTIVVAVLSFLNLLGVWNSILTTF
jgi:hypothetical protein